jgi:uncharacterized protein YjbI with pentapeptide repeats
VTSAGQIIAELTQPWQHGAHFDGRGLILEEPLILDGLAIRNVDFSGSQCRAGLQARGSRFLGMAWFREVRIDRIGDFNGAHFRNDLRADGMRAEQLNLTACRVQGVLSLARADIEHLQLGAALVMANMTLEEARISKKVDLSGAEIMGGLSAAGADITQLQETGARISGRIQRPD